MAVLHPHTSCVGRVLVSANLSAWRLGRCQHWSRVCKLMHKWQPGIAHQNLLPTCVQILTDKSCFITDKNYIFFHRKLLWSHRRHKHLVNIFFFLTTFVKLHCFLACRQISQSIEFPWKTKHQTTISLPHVEQFTLSIFIHKFCVFARCMWWLYWFMMILIVK